MNYIGSKHSLLDFLEGGILARAGTERGVFLDLFAGTGVVGRRFKALGFRVIANDIQYFAYCLNRAAVEVNRQPRFDGLRGKVEGGGSAGTRAVLAYLNGLEGIEGWIYGTYCAGGTRRKKHLRQYYSDDNGRRCDAIRQCIEAWRSSGQLSEGEYYYLIGCLIEAADRVANTASVYGAFLKHLKPSAQKPLIIAALPVVSSGRRHRALNEDGGALAARQKCDILYMDPPYNQRQYAANYHVLETIARYDSPKVRGITGLRPYDHQKSDFCNRSRALRALEGVVKVTSARHVFLSYNSEGLMPKGDIQETMGRYGKVELLGRDHPRFRADIDRENRVYKADRVTEYLFCLKKE